MPESGQMGRIESQNSERQDEMNRGFEAVSEEQNSMETNVVPRNGRNGTRGSSNRGFAAMSPERQKQIASEGGRAAHEQGVAHEWNSDEARKAGRKGGQIVSQNREHMSEIGRRGGQNSGRRRNRNQQNENQERE